MKSHLRKSREDRAHYNGYLWEESEEEPGRERDNSPHETEPPAEAQLRIEEASGNLLCTAREVCSMYPKSPRGPYRVSFYGYNSLKSTIRQQKSGVAIRVSHLLLDAPKEVLGGVLHTLLARFHGRPVPKERCKAYDEFCRRPEIEDRMHRLRKMRGRKILVGTKGEVRDLDDAFKRINETYFAGRIPKPTLTWSPGASRRTMGYYDNEFNTIVISSRLDSNRVPLYVLDYIMYHELLHIVCPIRSSGRRRKIHTQEFKRRERQYPDFDRAVRWIGKYWR
ncbi:MAG: hypothetical protein ABIH23_26385 [bacterium]